MNKVIISSGNRRLIGEIKESKGEIKPGDNVVVHSALELRCDMFMIPTPNGPIGIYKTTVTAIDIEEQAVDIEAKIDNIRWFSDMPDKGQKYEIMIDDFEQMMIQNRASKAGLTTAKNVPSGKPGGSKSGLIL